MDAKRKGRAMTMHMRPGTILDGHYRILSVLGQGGFGITYAAENVRLEMKVAIKELFWRDHSLRSSDAPPEVVLARPSDGPLFEAQKQRFLKEAKTLMEFAGTPGVVRVLDYFEANGTAYIVMEYIEGVTLASAIAHDPPPAESVVRSLLPLIDVLGEIHAAGVIHRDISPDNIIVQPGGSLKLIDFGAARSYAETAGPYTAISRSCYSPSEQYDANGNQGPWTDVYSICATLYTCVAGTPPQSAVQRLFLDELAAPSSLGIDVDPALESVIMKGLSLGIEQRWQSMAELSAALRAALPDAAKEEPKPPRRRWPLVLAIALLLCAVLTIGTAYWLNHRGEIRLKNIPTETLRVCAPSDMTAADFAAAQDELRGRLDDFAGKGNYIMRVNGDHIDVVAPLESFGEREVIDVIRERFSELVPGRTMFWQYEIRAEWESPATGGGGRQIAPEAFDTPTATLLYAFTDVLTSGQRDNLISDIKVQLDALDQPYAIGWCRGNPQELVVRLPIAGLTEFIVDMLVSNSLQLTAVDSYSRLPVYRFNAEFVSPDAGDGNAGLRLRYDSEELEKYTRAMLDADLHTLYLTEDGSDRYIIASAPIDAPITDGIIAFSDLRMADPQGEGIGPGNFFNFLQAKQNDTELPTGGWLTYYEYRGADGAVDFDGAWDYGENAATIPDSEADLALMSHIRQETGYDVQAGPHAYWIFMNLPCDETLPEAFSRNVQELAETYGLFDRIAIKSVYINATSDDSAAVLRVYMYPEYDASDGRFVTGVSLYALGEAIEPYVERIDEWWNNWEFDSDSVRRID